MQRGPSPRRPPGRTSGARKADAQPGRAAGRGPPGPWAPARRCSRLTTVLHLEPPQTELPSEATSLGWKPGLCPGPEPPASQSRSARHPAASSPQAPGMRAALLPASLASGRRSPQQLPGPRTGRGWSPGCGLACRAKALCPPAGGRPCPSAAGAEVAVSGPRLAQLFLLFLATLVLAFTASRPDAVSSLCLVKRFNFGTERTGALPPSIAKKNTF